MRGLARWWNDLRVSTKGYLVLAIPVVCLIAVATVGLALSGQVDQLRATTTKVTHAIDHLSATLQDLVDAESGVRAYVATDDATFLQQYHRAVRSLGPVVEPHGRRDLLSTGQTRQLNASGSHELAVLAGIRVEEDESRLTPSARDAALRTEERAMDRVRTELTGIQSVLRGRLRTDQQQLASTQTVAVTVDIVGLAVGVLGSALAAFLFLMGVVRRLDLVSANAERLGREQPMEHMESSGDAIGRVQAQLATTSENLSRRAHELRHARDEAVSATGAKDEFISRMSHELRTPLTSVLGFGELLQFEDLGPENADSVNRIVKAGRHLLDLINDLLDVSRIEAGHLALTLEAVEVAEVVAEVTALLRPAADDRRITVEVTPGDLAPGELAVVADRQRLQQVLLNLVSNAIKYNHEGGRIVLSAAATPRGTVRLEVRDTGVGISAESLDRLFVAFERLGAEASGVQGTGVGLALSKALAEAMNGTIGVESETARGSTFWLELPDAALPDAALRSGTGLARTGLPGAGAPPSGA